MTPSRQECPGCGYAASITLDSELKDRKNLKNIISGVSWGLLIVNAGFKRMKCTYVIFELLRVILLVAATYESSAVVFTWGPKLTYV